MVANSRPGKDLKMYGVSRGGSGWPGTPMEQAGLDFVAVLLPLTLKFWD